MAAEASARLGNTEEALRIHDQLGVGRDEPLDQQLVLAPLLPEVGHEGEVVGVVNDATGIRVLVIDTQREPEVLVNRLHLPADDNCSL